MNRRFTALVSAFGRALSSTPEVAMTQIRHLDRAIPRRPGELGVHSLNLFNLIVPNAEDARKFYSAFGLDVREEGDALHVHTEGHTHRWGTIVEGTRKKLNFISFGAFEDDL